MIKDKKRYRILVMEDNPGDQAIVEYFLAEQILAPVIVKAGSFKQASAILSDPGEIFDVILLDLTLPDKSGQGLITEMLRIASLCPIIILTGYTDIDFSIKSITQGILDYLLKDDLNALTLYKSIVYAIERKKAISEKDLQEHAIIKAIIKTQEDERYEIGGELHDNICQILGACQLHLCMLKEYLPASKLSLFDLCKGNIRLAIDEIRNLSHRLAPVFFDNSTMEEAFSRLFNTFNTDEKTELLMHFDDGVSTYPLSLDIRLNLYRILQEQFRNILQYAKATLIEVDVLIYNKKLKMKVSDNGIGFNADVVKDGIGLANMKRRAELFSGKFEIDSSPGNGCTITIDIPLPELIPGPLTKIDELVTAQTVAHA